MERQRQMARESWTGSGQTAQGGRVARPARPAGPHRLHRLRPGRRPPARLLALVKDGARGRAAAAGETVEALFDHTPVLRRERRPGRRPAARSNGPAAARRVARHPEAGRRPLRPQASKIIEGALVPGARVRLAVDPERRLRTRANHSAAHLVHAALRHVLGPHVAQKGQLVDGERMRFDFCPFRPADGRRDRPHRGRGQRRDPPEPAGRHPRDGARGGDRGRRRGPVRREVRRQRARADPRPRAGRARAPIRSSCAAAPMWRAPATSPCSRSSPKAGVAAGVRRIEALTGESARRWLLDQARRRQGPGRPVQGPGGRGPGAGRGPGRRAAQAGARPGRAPSRSWPWAAAARRRQGPEEVGGRQVRSAGCWTASTARTLRPIAEDFRKQIGRRRRRLCGGRRRQGRGRRGGDPRPGSAASAPSTSPAPRSRPWAARAPAASPTSPRAARPTAPRPPKASPRSRRRWGDRSRSLQCVRHGRACPGHP